MIDRNKEIWIFLSHSNEDYELVRRVRNILEDMNARPIMFFLKCLNDNDEIEDLIKREIEARTRFILCDSENARKSNWVSKEIEYISELHKPYDTIDINAPEAVIRDNLKELFRKEHIFISYPKELKPAIDIVSNRLSKYDFCTSFIDIFDMPPGISFVEIIKKNIKKAVERGRFIVLLSRHSTQSASTQLELDFALNLDTNYRAILPIYLDNEAKEYFGSKLGKYEYIDLSNNITPNKGQPDSQDIPYRRGSLKSSASQKWLGNDIVNAILVRLLGWGNIITYADKFRKGIDVQHDDDEADKLAALYVEHLEGVDCGEYFNGPGMLLVLGQLFQTGTGVRKNIDKALEYYQTARIEYGITIDNYIKNIDDSSGKLKKSMGMTLKAVNDLTKKGFKNKTLG